MATIPYKLEEITSEYSLFRDNQVLTASQLNEIVHFFEDQQRLSRILLTGVGRVCGFDLKWNAGAGTIELSQGVGVTTDGDLVHLDKPYIYSKFKVFEDDNARYPLFYPDGDLYPIWELFEGDITEEEVSGLTDFSGFQAATTIHPNSLALILYVENFGKTPDICTKLDCDNQGDRQMNKIHALLIKKIDLEQIITLNDSIFSTCRQAGNLFFDLPKIEVPRVILNTGRTQSFTALATAYKNAITKHVGVFQTAINTMLGGFKWLLDPNNQTSQSSIQARITQVFQTEIATPDLDIQYRYDLLKDVLDTYSELRSLIWDLCVQCCPDVHAFPKHLMVRELLVTDEHQPQYRHHFYPSPAVTDKNDRIHEVRALYQRLHRLLFDYNKPGGGQTIKITPSKMPLIPLGQRAIPFYLKPNLRTVWDGMHIKFQREKEHLSYLADGYADIESVKKPLEYNIDPYDFFRIEGHIGQSFSSAITDISDQIHRYQIPIEVIGLRLGAVADSIDISEYECYFEDLLVILLAWQEEQKCIWSAISKFFSGFYLKSPEVHIEYGARVAADKAVEIADTKKAIRIAGKSSEKISLSFGKEAEYTAYNRLGKDAFVEYKTYEGNPVEDNLVKEEDYVGFVMVKVIQDHADASYAEIKDLAIQQIDTIPEVKEWDSDVYQMAVDIPVNMLSLAYEVNRMKPASIAELNVEVLDSFKLSMDRICQNLKGWQKTISSRFYKTDYTRVGFEDRYEQLLSQVAVNCCAADKLKILLEEIDRRKVKILEMTMLANYIEKHPGMEHMAGAPKGGTFILVYKGKSPSVAGTNASVGFEIREEAKAKELEIGRKEASLKKSGSESAERMTIFNAEKEKSGALDEFDSIKDALKRKDYDNVAEYLRALASEARVEAAIPVGDFQVVADFALPYLCCSDCPPISFVVPKEKVSLIVPDHICYVEGMDPVGLTVVPVDGEVKTDQGKNLVSRNEGGQWVFDPNNLSSELFGTVINFTVNEQVTDTTTIVFHQPQPAIELVETRCVLDKGIAIATFRNTTPLVDGVNFSYEWNFGDGTIENNSSLLVTHIYKDVKPNVSQTFDVTLKATNKRCTETTEPLSVDILCEQDNPEEPKCLEIARTNYARFKELFGEIDPKKFPENTVGFYNLTQEVFAIVDKDFERVYQGELNANLFPQLVSLINDTLNALIESEEERDLLIQLLRIQIMLLLSILRCQDLDITDKEKDLFEFLSKLPDVIASLMEKGFEIDKDGLLREHITGYLKDMESDRGILKPQLEKLLEVLNQ